MTLQYDPELVRLAARMRALPGRLGREGRIAAAAVGREWHRRQSAKLVANAYRGFGFKRPATGNRSGQLRRSLFSRAMPATPGNVAWRDVSLEVGSRMPAPYNYARMQELGGTIRPKRGRFLTIPLPAALTPAGVLRKPARQWKGAFFVRTKKGQLMLARNVGSSFKGWRVEPLFLLVRSVTLKPKLGMRATATETFYGEFGKRAFQGAISRGVGSLKKGAKPSSG